jgi:hypothetical protein
MGKERRIDSIFKRKRVECEAQESRNRGRRSA